MSRASAILRLPLLIAGASILGAGAFVMSQPSATPAADWQPARVAAAPPPLPAVTAAPMPVAAPTTGLQLKGVLGYRGGAGAAIFSLADGRQFLVAVGHRVMPGVTLEAIAVDHVTIHDGVQRLDLALPQPQAQAGEAPLPTAAAAVTPDPRRDLANFRLGLTPEGDAKRPRGYRIRGDVPLPGLDRAGLQAGDLVLAVNGQPLDPERLLELPSELNAATAVEIDYERAGKRLHAVVPTR